MIKTKPKVTIYFRGDQIILSSLQIIASDRIHRRSIWLDPMKPTAKPIFKDFWLDCFRFVNVMRNNFDKDYNKIKPIPDSMEITREALIYLGIL